MPEMYTPEGLSTSDGNHESERNTGWRTLTPFLLL